MLNVNLHRLLTVAIHQIKNTLKLMVKVTIACLLVSVPYFTFSQDTTIRLNVMSYNVRYNTPKDSLNAWPYRKEKVASLILSNKVDIAGLQEPWIDQILDLENLMPEYDWIGWSRDNGKLKGEFTPVFFLKEKFSVMNKGVFWLSSTPEIAGSIGWDERLPRTVIWILFKDKASGKEFYFINTHLGGNIARKEGAKLLKTKIDELVGDLPVIVTGDFNSAPDTEPIQTMLSKEFRVVLEDAFDKAEEKNDEIYTNYLFDGNDKDLKRIDYIFVNKPVCILYHEIVNKRIGEYYPSDHLAIKADIKF